MDKGASLPSLLQHLHEVYRIEHTHVLRELALLIMMKKNGSALGFLNYDYENCIYWLPANYAFFTGADDPGGPARLISNM